jgi:ADP-heptose:LPS heptosyltransferase
MASVHHTPYLGDSIHLYAVWKQDQQPSFRIAKRYEFLFPEVETAARTMWTPRHRFTGPRHGQHVRDMIAEAFGVDATLVGGSLFTRPPKEDYVALCPNASRPDKEWHPGLWKLIKDHLDAKGIPYRWLPMKGRYSEMELPEVVDILSRARAAVSVDSGPVHVADAFGIPVVGLFGPTSPVCYGPYQFRRLAVSHHPHPEDTARWCRNGKDIMVTIRAFEVIAKLEEALKL